MPLHEALAKAKYLGKDRVNGRECDAFLFPAVHFVSLQDQVFYLDATSHIPIRVSSYADQASREKDAPYWVWTADKLETIPGHVIAVKSTQNHYDRDRNQIFTRTFTVKSIRFDGEYPATMFLADPQPGVQVIDQEGK